jgi:hypothetical protein
MKLLTAILIFGLSSVVGFSQSSNGLLESCIYKIPGIITEADSAYKLFELKQGKDFYLQTEKLLLAELKKLALLVQNKSLFIAQAAGTYDENKLYRHPNLPNTNPVKQKLRELNMQISMAFDEFMRKSSAAHDSVFITSSVSLLRYNVYLFNISHYYEELNRSVNPLLRDLDKFILDKYKSLLQNFDPNNPEAIAVLEARAFILNKQLLLCQLARSSGFNASSWMKTCKKNPAFCN